MSKFLDSIVDRLGDVLHGWTNADDEDLGDDIISIKRDIQQLGENARRMLEVGAVQDELVKLGFSQFGLCDYVLTDNKGTQIVGIDFVNLIISTSYFGGEQYYYSYASPTWQEDLINRVKGLIK